MATPIAAVNTTTTSMKATTPDALRIAIANLAREIANRFGTKYASSLLRVLDKWGAVGSVNMLCHREPSGMFHMLFRKGALGLSVEALVLREEFEEIIPPSTREAARRRLDYFGGFNYLGGMAIA